MEIVKDEELVDLGDVAVKKDSKEEQKPIEYDPNKKYTWKPTDVFYFSGNDFGVVLNALGAILTTPEARTIQLVERAHNMAEEALLRSIQAGIATEVKNEKK